MPYWTHEQEMALMDMVTKGKSLEATAEHFQRSPEATRLKIRRMGLAVPEGKKEVDTTRTPQQALTPLKPTEGLVSEKEAVCMWLGAVRRLNEPELSGLELKRLRLVLSALKTYVVSIMPAYEHIRKLELEIDRIAEKTIELYESNLRRTDDEQEKAELQRSIDELRAEPEVEEPEGHIWPRRHQGRRPTFDYAQKRS